MIAKIRRAASFWLSGVAKAMWSRRLKHDIRQIWLAQSKHGAFHRRKLIALLMLMLNFLIFWRLCRYAIDREPIVIVITPTYPRPARMADMTRLAQTLMHIRNIHWIVVDDNHVLSPDLSKLLGRSKISFTYTALNQEPSVRGRGMTQRNYALKLLRESDEFTNGVVYFADDDNAYDIRLFDDYIRNVKTIGFWAVGLVASSKVEAPLVNASGRIVGWNVRYRVERKFATDMSGFAVNLQLIRSKNVTFNVTRECFDPESCFLERFDIPKEQCEVFGWRGPKKEVLVWHTRTYIHPPPEGSDHGYAFETRRPPLPTARPPPTVKVFVPNDGRLNTYEVDGLHRK